MSKLILSLDGGGIRGAATAQFLMRVDATLGNEHRTSLREQVDFYAGTSTGSLIALALATTDMSLEDINGLYSATSARQIFADNRGWFELDGINAPKYEAKGKSTMLKKHLGQARLRDVPAGKQVLVVTYGIERRRPHVLKSSKREHHKLLAWQAADASSAAPTYFPTRDMKLGPDNEQTWLIDGGVIATTPPCAPSPKPVACGRMSRVACCRSAQEHARARSTARIRSTGAQCSGCWKAA